MTELLFFRFPPAALEHFNLSFPSREVRLSLSLDHFRIEFCLDTHGILAFSALDMGRAKKNSSSSTHPTHDLRGGSKNFEIDRSSKGETGARGHNKCVFSFHARTLCIMYFVRTINQV